MKAMEKHPTSLLNWHVLARHQPSAFLLAAQLVSLVLYAVIGRNASGRAVLGALGVVIMMLVVWVIQRSPAINWIAWILVAPAIVLSLLAIVFFDPTYLIWSAVLESVLYFYAAGSLVAYMMKDYRVTPDELFAAGATYTLLAWGFAYAYLVCQAWFPGSFIGLSDPGQPRAFLELLFLSFTNLTATGIGDILPVGPFARILVMLEQFAGIGYVAVVVSRLIGLTIARYEERGKS